ncbi:DUF6877 family protein [Paenibacillus larvae]
MGGRSTDSYIVQQLRYTRQTLERVAE